MISKFAASYYWRVILFLSWSVGGWSIGSVMAQLSWRIEQAPEYSAYETALKNRGGRGGSNWSDLGWTADGAYLKFRVGNKTQAIDLQTGQIKDEVAGELVAWPEAPQRPRKTPVARAEQRAIEISPDGRWRAVYRDNNVHLEPVEENAGPSVAVTTTGQDRLRYGTGCWVYGEELDQKEAMWWSPDNQWLVFYEVDEQGLPDYFLTINNVQTYTDLHVTRYPKAGYDNPQVNLLAYHLESKTTKRLSIPGEPRQYLYNITFTPNGEELLVNRTNRRQDHLDVLAINLESGNVRVVVSETQTTWQNNSPEMLFLADGQRFVWETEKNGWKNYELRNLAGERLAELTQCEGFPCEKIVKVDEAGGWLYYTAYSDAVPYNEQLHRVRLNGAEDTRITSSPLHHTNFDLSPLGNYVACVRQQVNVAPERVVYRMDGSEVFRMESPAAPIHSELFSFMSPDGQTTLYGTLHKPSNFDPQKKYPLVIDVYGGPGSRGMSNNFAPSNALCELGFIVAKIGNRGTVGRGKAFESATYLALGIADLDDQAAGVKFLAQRPYIDGTRVGIYGHSYGGYMSALALLRYPDVFQVGVSGAPVTDWKNYDSIYTERYMRTPQENPEGYQQGSCMTHAENLRGQLLIVHGLIDDNVHPANTWQLIKALQEKNQRFDLMVYPEFKHGIGSNYSAIRTEYLYRHLKLGHP